MISINKKLQDYLQNRIFRNCLAVFLFVFIFLFVGTNNMPTASALTCPPFCFSPPPPPPPPPADCSGGLSWGGGCSVSSVSINHNGSQSVTDSSFDDKGTATYSCNDGSFGLGSWQCTLNPVSSSININPVSGAMDTYFDVSWSGNLDSSQNGDDGVTYYKLQVNGIEFPLGNVTSWRGNAESLGFIPGSVNTFKVDACNIGGCSGWSSSVIFTVNGGAAPTLTTLTLNPVMVDINTNFNASWVGNNTPTSYKLKIGSRIYNMFSATNLTSTPASLGLATGVHQVSAQSCNAKGCVWSAPVALTVTDPSAASGMWAWSDNIGWVNINCISTTDGCPGTSNSNYGINIDGANILPNSYIWSDNIGWISFDRAKTGTPPDGSVGSIAKYNSSTGNFSGWARALSACQNNPGTPAVSCSSSGAGNASQGWDGWISLSGLSPNYTVNYFGGSLGNSSWSWGSSVIGWLKFSGGSVVIPLIPPSGSITADACTIALGSSDCPSRVAWSSNNFVGGAEVYQGNLSFPSRFSTAASNPGTNRPTNPTNNIFYLKDSGSGFLTSVTADVKCAVGSFWNGSRCRDSFASSIPRPPLISIEATPSLVRMGETSRIEVHITADASVSHTYDCTFYGVVGSPDMETGLSGNEDITVYTEELSGVQIVKVKCVVNGFPGVDAEAEKRVNVVPNFEES